MALKSRPAWFASCPGAYRRGDRTAVSRGTAMAHLRTGMVIDPVRDLDLGATGQEDRPILSVALV
jgi:hypothetical protein